MRARLLWFVTAIILAMVLVGSMIASQPVAAMPPAAATARPRATQPIKMMPAPTLISPVDDYHALGQPGPDFVWAFNGKLGKNDYYMFSIEHGKGLDVRCYKATTGQARDYIPTLPFSDNSLPFKWQVAVVRANKPVNEGDACTGTMISMPSRIFHLYWTLNAPQQDTGNAQPPANGNQPPPDKNCCSKGGGEGCDQNC